MLSQAQKSRMPAGFTEKLEHIRISGQALSEIVNNILDFSKIESGKSEILIEPIDVKQLIRNIYYVNKVQAVEKDHHFFYQIDPDLPQWIRSDRQKLSRILMNLINNAIKYTPENKIIHIKARKEK